MRYLSLALIICVAFHSAQASECSGADGSVMISATPLTFNDYFAGNPMPDTGNFTVTAACMGGSDSPVLPPLSLSLPPGLGSSSMRIMENGAHVLDYQIYTDDTLINVWGDGSGGGTLVSTSGGTQSQTFTGYGKIFASQWATVGTYTDEVTIIITY